MNLNERDQQPDNVAEAPNDHLKEEQLGVTDSVPFEDKKAKRECNVGHCIYRKGEEDPLRLLAGYRPRHAYEAVNLRQQETNVKGHD